MNLVEVKIWGKLVGVIVLNEVNNTTSFEYSKEFIKSNVQLSPIINTLSGKIIKANSASNYSNEESIEYGTNKGLPLFISDALPDRFGTELIAKQLEKDGISYRNFTPLEKLTYIGNRGMGALEFQPISHNQGSTKNLDLKKLIQSSKSILNHEPIRDDNDLVSLFHIGTSLSVAQPKILINIDSQNGKIYRGDILPAIIQECWELKFNQDTGADLDKERGKIEYAYYLMAKESKIEIMDSELKEIDGEHFFMTKRVDRNQGGKIHTQTLHAFAGMNFRLNNSYSYEQVFSVLNKINLDYQYKEQLFRIMVFNVISRNVDDHTKKFGFNLEKDGQWRLSPAIDLTFSYNENFNLETPHFLSINGKNKDFKLKDILHISSEYSIKNPIKIINEVNQSLLQWNQISTDLTISKKTRDYIASKMNTFSYKITTASST